MSKISTQGLCKMYILLFRRLYRRHTNCDQPTTIPLIPVGSNLAHNLYVLSLSRCTTVVQVPSFRNCLALRAATRPRSLVLQNRISSSTASRPSCSVSAGLSDLFCFPCPRVLASPLLLLRLRLTSRQITFGRNPYYIDGILAIAGRCRVGLVAFLIFFGQSCDALTPNFYQLEDMLISRHSVHY